MAKNFSDVPHNCAKESDERKIPENALPSKHVSPGGASVQFPDRPVLIVYGRLKINH